MRITENKLRLLARRVLKELFTSKSGVSAKNFLDQDVDPYAYGAEGGDFYESDELDEDEIQEDEERVE